jgi:glycogen debranching enzyme
MGEMTNTGELPFSQYYGSADATPMFIRLCGKYLQRSGDVTFARKIWPHIERALTWIDQFGDQDGDGFVGDAVIDCAVTGQAEDVSIQVTGDVSVLIHK